MSKELQRVRAFPCCACGRPGPSECHHVRTRGSGGTDDPRNLLPLCTGCHTGNPNAWHRGRETFLDSFPHVREILKKMGWEFLAFGRMHHEGMKR